MVKCPIVETVSKRDVVHDPVVANGDNVKK